MAKEPINKLKIYEKELKELASHVSNNIDYSLWDFDFEKEEFMEKYNEFKKKYSNYNFQKLDIGATTVLPKTGDTFPSGVPLGAVITIIGVVYFTKIKK